MNKDGVIMVVNPFKSMSLEELKVVADDVVTSKREGRRVESFVPYARDIMANLNVSVENPTIPLRECLSMAKDDFYMELCTRLVNGSFDVMSDMSDSDKKELQDFRERETPKKVIVSAWNPDKCPCCHAELSESLGDGYYSHPTFLERCPKCLQKLVWDE